MVLKVIDTAEFPFCEAISLMTCSEIAMMVQALAKQCARFPQATVRSIADAKGKQCGGIQQPEPTG